MNERDIGTVWRFKGLEEPARFLVVGLAKMTAPDDGPTTLQVLYKRLDVEELPTLRVVDEFKALFEPDVVDAAPPQSDAAPR